MLQKLPRKEKISSRKKTQTEACSLEMQSHLQRLGFSSVKAYKMWCCAHHFGRGLNKTARQRRKELEFVAGMQATETMQEKKKNESLLKQIILMLHEVAKSYAAERDRLKEHYLAERDKLDEHYLAERDKLKEHYCWYEHYCFEHYLAERDRLKEHYLAERDKLDEHYDAERNTLKERYRTNMLEEVEAAFTVQLDEVTRATVEPIWGTFRDSNELDLLKDCLLYLEANSNLLKLVIQYDSSVDHTFYFYGYIESVGKLADDFKSWVRPLKEWQPKSRNQSRQFSELLRHLFADYPVPLFMDRVFFGTGDRREWFRHIGTGQNIRTAPDLPLPLTRKMAHYFLMTPKHYRVDEAFIWAQVRALGGGQRCVGPLIRGFYKCDGLFEPFFEDNSFWLNVIRFFSMNPMLEAGHVDLMIDYIFAQKYLNNRDHTDFSMKGRTAAALLRQAQAWRRDLDRAEAHQNIRWPCSDIGEFHLQEVEEPSGTMKSWYIRELCSAAELFEEGRTLAHCLRHDSEYAQNCYQGSISIWTMETREGKEKRRKVLTLQVQSEGDYGTRIAYVSGRRNREPKPEEARIIEKWAIQEGLEFS